MRDTITFLDVATFGPMKSFKKPQIGCDWIQYEETRECELAERIQESTILIVNKVRLRRENLRFARKLRFIALCATGADNLDLEYCSEHGIVVSNIRDYAFDSVPEHVFAMILTLRKSLPAYREAMIQRRWEKDGKFCLFLDPIFCLSGQRIGIIGSGALGQRVARIAKAFDMEVFFAERKNAGSIPSVRAGFLPFQELIATSHVISVHCPLNQETKNLIAKSELSRMRKECLLINAARGGIIHEAELTRALEQGVIAGAGIDVVTRTEAYGEGWGIHDLLIQAQQCI